MAPTRVLRGRTPTPAVRLPPLDSESGPLTELGAVMGTPAYMSPEQANGQPAIEASDIYSLGVIGFEMLTGAPPFSGSTGELLTHHVETPVPDPGRSGRQIPRSMRRAIRHALAKDPRRRPATPAEFVRELSGSLRTDQLAERATLLYVGLATMWIIAYLAVTGQVDIDAPARVSAVSALATCNVIYFLALSLGLMVAEYRRETHPERLWPLCLLAFPLTPVWLLLVWLDRRRRRRQALRETSQALADGPPLLDSAA